MTCPAAPTLSPPRSRRHDERERASMSLDVSTSPRGALASVLAWLRGRDGAASGAAERLARPRPYGSRAGLDLWV